MIKSRVELFWKLLPVKSMQSAHCSERVQRAGKMKQEIEAIKKQNIKT